MIQALSEAVGLSEQTLIFVLGLFSIYPFAALYRSLVWNQSKTVQNAFFAMSGFSLVYACFGIDVMNILTCIVAQWLMLKTLLGTKFLVPCSFLFQMGYLIYGYYATEASYITWTMPGCVLCLRMIGLAFDCHDGTKEKLRPEQIERALKKVPSLLEITAFSLNFNGVLIGPQFPFVTHDLLVSGKLIDSTEPPKTVLLSMKTLMHGIGMLVLHQVMCSESFFPTSYLESDEYFTKPFWYRIAFISLNGIFYFHKHVATWTIIRGGNILTGIGYQKKNEIVSFDKFKNVDYKNFHLAQSNHDVIRGFNLCTNDWAARYIFKRCIWMGNKNVSHALTLLFLAVWHGTDLCYFTSFTHEFMVVNAEKEFWSASEKVRWISGLPGWFKNFVGYVYMNVTWGFATIDFRLVNQSFWKVWKSIYHCHQIFFILMWSVSALINRSVTTTKTKVQ